jgi:hypothetical protein
MEARCFSEMSVDFQRTTECYIPEDRTLNNHSYENVRSYMYGLWHKAFCLFQAEIWNLVAFLVSSTQLQNRTDAQIKEQNFINLIKTASSIKVPNCI